MHLRAPHDKVEDEGRWRELVRTNDAVLVSAVGALLDAAYIPHVVLDQNMSVLEGSIGILPRRILVNECCIDDARELLEDAGLVAIAGSAQPLSSPDAAVPITSVSSLTRARTCWAETMPLAVSRKTVAARQTREPRQMIS